MAVQLNISFETLVELVTQLPKYQQQALVRQLQQSDESSELTLAEKIALLESAQIALDVNVEPSIRREDWYDVER